MIQRQVVAIGIEIGVCPIHHDRMSCHAVYLVLLIRANGELDIKFFSLTELGLIPMLAWW